MLHQFVQAAFAEPTSILVKIILSLRDRYCKSLSIFSKSDMISAALLARRKQRRPEMRKLLLVSEVKIVFICFDVFLGHFCSTDRFHSVNWDVQVAEKLAREADCDQLVVAETHAVHAMSSCP